MKPIFIAIVAAAIAAPDWQDVTEKVQISGRVVNAQNAPLAGATVKISHVDSKARVEKQTNEQGAFQFDGVAAGWYGVSAMASGYATAEFGATRTGGAGTPVVIESAVTSIDLTFRLQLTAEVSGIVRQTAGLPFGGVRVEALQEAIGPNGRTYLAIAGATMTDDRGRYQIAGLSAGAYFFRVSPPRAPISPGNGSPASRVLGYATTYYPNALSASEAAQVELSSGEQHDGTDILLRTVTLATIRGRSLAGGEPIEAGEATLQGIDGRGLTGPRASVQPGRDGTFTVPNCPPGTYVVRVQAIASGARMTASRIVEVRDGDDAVDVSLQLVPFGSITGSVTFEGDVGTAPPSVRLTLTDASDGLESRQALAVSIDQRRSLLFREVEPGTYRIYVASSASERPNWVVTSLHVTGIESMVTSLEVPSSQRVNVDVILAKASAELLGTLRTADGLPTTGQTIVLFAEDHAAWRPEYSRVKAVRPTTTGEFLFTDLLPGRYRVAVVADPVRNEWMRPTFLESVEPHSIPVTVDARMPARLDLRTK